MACGLSTTSVLAQPENSGSQSNTQVQSNEKSKKPALLLVDHTVHPDVEIGWIAGGEPIEFQAALPYTAPVGGDPLGKNIKCYVTLGGTRVETGAGHPKGAVIRLGITKIDNKRAFFTGIDPFTEIEFRLKGVRFNQPVKYHKATGLMHLKYAIGDLQACSLPGTARNQYLLSDPDDTLGGRVIAGENATPGALDGQSKNGDMDIIIDPDDPTRVDMIVRVPFGMLRHLQDPWESQLPGTFFEPIHLHAEAELIPIDVPHLDREPILPEINESELQSKDTQDESDE